MYLSNNSLYSEEWAYLAGLIDGEGDITITYTVRVRISNTNRDVIDWITDNFDGLVAVANSNTTLGKKTCWRVGWNGHNAAPILEGILPYLIIKRKLAELALQYIQYLVKPGQHELTRVEREARAVLRCATSKLNNRVKEIREVQ